MSVHDAAQLSVNERRLDSVLIGGVALLARLVHAHFVSRTPFFEGPVIDGFSYRSFALQIAHSGDFGEAFYQPPLYPTFLAALFRLGLGSAWSVAWVQAALGALTAILLASAARRLTSAAAARRMGLVTGLACALYGPLVLFDIELLPPCCVDLLFAASLELASRSAASVSGDATLGLLGGLGVVGWPPFAAFIPGFLALRGARGRRLVLALACAALPVAVTARHNAERGSPGVVVSYNLGINLWLGNAPDWRDTWRARPGAAFEPELERPDREGATTPDARSRYFMRAVAREARQHPLAVVSRTAEKLYYVLHGRELRRDNDIELLRDASPLLRWLVWEHGLMFPFGLVAPLALYAFWRRRAERRVQILAASALLYALVLAIFFVASRYRLLLALLFLPFAVEQAFWLSRAPRGLVPVAGMLLLLNLPNDFTRSFAASPAERGLLEAHALRNAGRLAAADTLAARLVQRFPADPNVQMLRAEQLVSTGACASAEPHLTRVIALAPRTTAPRLLLADCLEQLRRPAAAELAYAGALALHPFHPVALKRASALYLRQRRAREAKPLLERFIAAGYRDAQVDAWREELTSASGLAAWADKRR